MIRGAALASVLLLALLPSGVSAGGTTDVQVFSNGYSPSSIKIVIDSSVVWHNGSGDDHTSTADRFNTWDLFIAASSDSTQVYFPRSGGFAYHCEIHAGMNGKVKVRPSMNPVSGDLSTEFSLRVAVEDAPVGFTEDVQKRKVGKSYRQFASTTGQFVMWTANSPGTYQFRARLRKVGTSKATEWGAPVSVTVTS